MLLVRHHFIGNKRLTSVMRVLGVQQTTWPWGCDCLGVIKYFDAVLTEPDGTASLSKNVVCLHEQDNGVGWKHTNFRTQRAVVTRSRELVVQFIVRYLEGDVSYSRSDTV